MEAGSGGISGEVLANRLAVSRVAVGKHVASLRALGYQIEAEAGHGYRLKESPALALPDEVAGLVHDPFWTAFEGGVETVSTNADASTLAREGAPEGTVVVAASQTGGRGRLGREWSSAPGGAYVSVVLRPQVAPSDAGALSLVVGLGIARGLEALGVRPGLKWPNDVLLDGRKLAGVLLEMSAETDRIAWVVAGFGLNVVRPPEVDEIAGGSKSGLAEAAFVADVVPSAMPSPVAAAALDGVAGAYAEWSRSGFAALLPEYLDRFLLTGREVTVRDAFGTVRASGVCEGVDADGRLLVAATGSAATAVASGEVTLRSFDR